jgi:2-methylcitrate dehydratase PrpD
MPTAGAEYFDQLTDFAFDSSPESLPESIRVRSGWILADCLGVIATGMQASEMRRFVDAYIGTSAGGVSWLCGTARTSDSLSAAFLNGIAGTWYELDEGHTLSKGHPAIQIAPAAFAVAQEVGASGADLIAALAVAYEVSSRINLACRIRPQIHPHGTFGVVGAAIAVARLLKLPKSEAVESVRIAAGLPLATSYHSLIDGATSRNVFTGHSAFMGINAVRLARAGFTGEVDAVRTAYAGVLAENFNPDAAVQGLGQAWLLETSYFKLSPTARSVHPAIDAIEDAILGAPNKRFNPDDIVAIRARTYGLAAAKNQKDIRTDFGAKFSIPFALATCIVNNSSGLSSFSMDAVENLAVQRLTQLVDLSEDKDMSLNYPAQQRCDVSVTLKNGETYNGRCEIVRGEAGRPVTLDEIRSKFMDITQACWNPDTASKLFDACLSMEDINNVQTWSSEIAHSL